MDEKPVLQAEATKAQIILEYLRITAYDKNSGLLTEAVVDRRERLSAKLEEIVGNL